jgi:serine/threonine-protein kinase
VPADAGIRFGQYILLRRIARGGMAEVFLAQQRGLEGFDRRVAVKRILPHLADSPDFVKMFLGEAKLAAQLTHPNIVHIYEFGKVEHDYFIAMEFVDGVHAGQLFKLGESDRLSPTLVARIGADAATALHYAHELKAPSGKPYGLVHRDVSPANIMVSYDGIVKLCDFGIAKAAALGDQLTNPGQVKGKYAYMSPEQTVAAPLDGRSDVFSLAIVMWELLTGRYIVQRGDAVEAMRAIRDGKLDPIEKVAPHVPPALAKAITWALQPKKEDRATASDFAQALEAFIKSSPEIATAMQLGQFVRQRFTREHTGEHAAIRPGPGTVASPGTQVVQGTAVASSTQGALTVLGAQGKLVDIQPWPNDLDDENAQTLKKAEPPFAAKTMIDPSARAAQEPTLRDRTEELPDATEIRDHNETLMRPGAHRTPVPSGPAVVPTRIGPAVPAPQSGPRPRISASVLADSAARAPDSGLRRIPNLETGSRPKTRRNKPLIVVGVLGGLAVLSFVIALAASKKSAPPPRDAAATTAMTVVPLDAAVVVDAPAPPPADAAPAPVAEGYLEVHTIPEGGKVRVGDQVRGTPAQLVLTAGTHLVQADLPGYEPERREIELAAGEHQRIEITFRTKKQRAAEHATAMGKLSVRTTPYSNVYEGSRELGQTPFADLEMPAGVHTLTFKNPSHETVTKTVKIVAGKSTKLSFSLP